jgi:hypothetical protein
MGRFALKDLGCPVSLRGAREYLAQHGWHVREDGRHLVCEGPPDDAGRPVIQFLTNCALFWPVPSWGQDRITPH